MDYTKDDYITITNITASAEDSIDTFLGSNSNISITGGINIPWTTTSVSGDTFTLDPTWNSRASGKIQLDGPDADIEINGESLMTALKAMQAQLNILTPDPEMEKEWDDLRAIREQYEAKLQECREKSRVWAALKQSG